MVHESIVVNSSLRDPHSLIHKKQYKLTALQRWQQNTCSLWYNRWWL